jgi:hypothetical protein
VIAPAAPRRSPERRAPDRPEPNPSSDNRHPAEELSELFFAAGAEERGLILMALDYALLRPALPIAPALAQEASRQLELMAMQRDTEGFVQEIERTLCVSRVHARRMVEDPSGEPIVVAAKALAMPAAMLQRVLLFLNPSIGRSVSRVYELSALYEEITARAALMLFAIWHELHPRSGKPGHQTYHWHDTRRQAAQATSQSLVQAAKIQSAAQTPTAQDTRVGRKAS